MTGPQFSVVIPTRNRAHLLGSALATLRAQTWDDFEVVVSDNASGDDTRGVATAHDDGRVRYVRSDRALRQHDSWEFGVDHARGEWITVLGDDDGLVPSALERLASVTAGAGTSPVVWRDVWYYDPVFPPVWLGPGEANGLTVWPFSGRVDSLDSATAVDAVFRMIPQRLPGFYDACVHRDTVARVRGRLGRVFGDPDPFVSSGIAVALHEPKIVTFDLPLMVRGFSDATLSLNFVRNTRAAHEGVEEFDTEDLFILAPLRERTLATLVAETLLRLKGVLPDELAGHDLDLVAYFRQVRDEVDAPKRRPDGGAAVAEWKQVLSHQPSAVRRAVRSQLLKRHAVGVAKRVAGRVPGALALATRRRRSAGYWSAFQWTHGDEAGFKDLPGAAAWFDGAALPPPAERTASAA